MSAGGLATGARGFRESAAVSKCEHSAAGFRLSVAGEESHLYRR